MAERPQFILTEEPPSEKDFAAIFTWDSEHQSSPRNGWEWSVNGRTHREDLGPDATEQILGVGFGEFTLTGVWDDRYNYTGFAIDTLSEFEQMVFRANPISISFQRLQMRGIIKSFTPRYHHQGRIDYSFVFSAHRRNRTQEAEQTRHESLEPARDHDATVNELVAELQATQELAPMPQMTGSLYADVQAVIDECVGRAGAITIIVSARVVEIGAGPDPVSSLQRLSQAFDGLKTSALALPVILAEATYDNGLAWIDAIGALSFDEWCRSMSSNARRLALASAQAAEDVAKLDESEAVAIYRPRAGESLYEVSQRFYGTPHEWRSIADRNNLSDFELTGLEMLVIPKRPR
jgi:hypothetical protein